MALTIPQKVLILLTVPVLFEVGLVTYVTSLFDQIESSRLKAVHSRELTTHLNSIVNLHAQRVSLLITRKMKGQKSETNEETTLKNQIKSEIGALRLVSTSSPTAQMKWKKITDLFAEIDRAFDEASAAYTSGEDLKASMIWATAQNKVAKLITISNQLSDDQRIETQKSEAEYEIYDQQLRLTLKMSLYLSAILVFALAIFFNNSTTKRLNKLMRNTTLLSVGKAPQETIGGGDELAKIDKIHHQMHEILTQLRQKERAILDNAAEAICSLDADLKLTEFNHAASRLWNRTESLIGTRLVELVSEEDQEMVISKLEEAETSTTEVRFEAKIRSGEGLSTTNLDTAWAATWSQANTALYCVLTDISARKKLDQLKREYVAMLSHDLRTPLSSVQASLEIMSSEHLQLPDDARKYIERAERGLKLSLSLINQLLEIEKMESGVIALELDAVNTQELFNKAYSSVASLADNRKVTIKYTGPTIEFVADPDRLVQVLINLLGNALKFSEQETKITVRGELREESLQTKFARISVTDQGRGIPAEKLEQIFDRFQQVDPKNEREKAGSGLGLAICKAIVEAHGGRIGITSTVDIGSTFWFEIPITG